MLEIFGDFVFFFYKWWILVQLWSTKRQHWPTMETTWEPQRSSWRLLLRLLIEWPQGISFGYQCLARPIHRGYMGIPMWPQFSPNLVPILEKNWDQSSGWDPGFRVARIALRFPAVACLSCSACCAFLRLSCMDWRIRWHWWHIKIVTIVVWVSWMIVENRVPPISMDTGIFRMRLTI